MTERLLHVQAPAPEPSVFGMGLWSGSLCGLTDSDFGSKLAVRLVDLFTSVNPIQTAEAKAREWAASHPKCPGCWASLPSLVAHITRYKAWRMYNLVQCTNPTCWNVGQPFFYGDAAWTGGTEPVCGKCSGPITKPTTPLAPPKREASGGLAQLFA